MEAEDLGTYVVKFYGAGQGRKVLVAEVLVGELARALGLPVPELVLVEVDPVLGRAEPDEEVQDLLRASPGLNLGMDFLPGALGFDPVVHEVPAGLASRVVWLDAFVGNVDRSWRNPNLLLWHRRLHLIDHGATLVFHHDWSRAAGAAGKPYDASGHVLEGFATQVPAVGDELAGRITRDLLDQVAALVPDEWLADEPGFASPAEVRSAYVAHFLRRLEARPAWQP
jgi:hypothetical protein